MATGTSGAPLACHFMLTRRAHGSQADPESESLPLQWLSGNFDSMVVHCDDLKGGEALLTEANYQLFRKSLGRLRVSQLVVKEPKKRPPSRPVAAVWPPLPPLATSQAAKTVSALDAALASRAALSNDLVMD